MFLIEKVFEFSAAHHLVGLKMEHPCSRNHGHNYIVKFALSSGELNSVGFVRDYTELNIVKQWLDANWDHKDLNTVLSFNPTAECLAKFLYERFSEDFPELLYVGISETPKTWAYYGKYLLLKG